jgi:radical SAM superfamily enzyme YgiQ (UPF0313 family)
MKVLLLYPSWTSAYGWVGYFARRNAHWPPINQAGLAAILEKRGHEVTIIDGEVLGMSPKKMIKNVLDIQPDIIGLSSYSPFFHINKELAKEIKCVSNIPVTIGGPHITIMKEKEFDPSAFDFLFVGEAEHSFLQFLDQYERGGDLSEVGGIIYKPNGEIVSTGSPDPIVDINGDGYPLDQFPFPARHLLPMEKYKLGTLGGRLNMTSIQTMRGCPWKCIFCASEALNTTRVIKRSPRSIVDEIKTVVSDYNIKHFFIVDDVMTLWPDHITEICDLLDKEELEITFEGSTRANLITDDIIKRLVKSGLIRLSFGLETVDSEMRKTMKKKVPLEHYINANKILNKYNVEALNSVMIGLPGETRETVEKTLVFLENSQDIKQANFAITVPYPGTELHEIAKEGKLGVKLLSEDFSEYRRYGAAVTQINELSPNDLIDLQNEGFVRIYSKPWRWKSVFGKHGIIGGILMLFRVLKLMRKKLQGKNNSSMIKLGIEDTGLSGMRVSDAPTGHMGSPKNPNLL